MMSDGIAKLSMMYGYEKDYTKHYRVLAAQTVGSEPTAEFAKVFKEVTGDDWSLTPKQEYTLYGSKVVYLGVNKPEFPTANRFTYVICIKLSVRYGGQRVYLHFNVPEDKSA